MDKAKEFGEIIDLPFPFIEPTSTSKHIDAMVENYYLKVKEYKNPVVMLMGEFVFTFRLITKLKKDKIKVLSARSKREVQEEVQDDGSVVKKSVFQFIDFIEY